MANRGIPSYSNNGDERSKIKQLEVSNSAIGRPDVGLYSGFQLSPTWERIPCPVKSSVPRPITKPSMASRPFHCSAKDENPKFDLLILG